MGKRFLFFLGFAFAALLITSMLPDTGTDFFSAYKVSYASNNNDRFSNQQERQYQRRINNQLEKRNGEVVDEGEDRKGRFTVIEGQDGKRIAVYQANEDWKRADETGDGKAVTVRLPADTDPNCSNTIGRRYRRQQEKRDENKEKDEDYDKVMHTVDIELDIDFLLEYAEDKDMTLEEAAKEVAEELDIEIEIIIDLINQNMLEKQVDEVIDVTAEIESGIYGDVVEDEEYGVKEQQDLPLDKKSSEERVIVDGISISDAGITIDFEFEVKANESEHSEDKTHIGLTVEQ